MIFLAFEPPISKELFEGGNQNEFLNFCAPKFDNSVVAIAATKPVPKGFFYTASPDSIPMDKKSAIRLTDNQLGVWWDLGSPSMLRPSELDYESLRGFTCRNRLGISSWTPDPKPAIWKTKDDEAATLDDLTSLIQPTRLTWQDSFGKYRFRFRWKKEDGARKLLDSVAQAMGAKLVETPDKGLRLVVDPIPHRNFLIKNWKSKLNSNIELERVDAKYLVGVLPYIRPELFKRAYEIPRADLDMKRVGFLAQVNSTPYKLALERLNYLKELAPPLAQAVRENPITKVWILLHPGGTARTEILIDKQNMLHAF